MHKMIDQMSNYELQEQITTQLGKKSVRNTIHEIGYAPDDFTNFSISMLIAYVNSLVITPKKSL